MAIVFLFEEKRRRAANTRFFQEQQQKKRIDEQQNFNEVSDVAFCCRAVSRVCACEASYFYASDRGQAISPCACSGTNADHREHEDGSFLRPENGSHDDLRPDVQHFSSCSHRH